jgi:hypothetical protein
VEIVFMVYRYLDLYLHTHTYINVGVFTLVTTGTLSYRDLAVLKWREKGQDIEESQPLRPP